MEVWGNISSVDLEKRRLKGINFLIVFKSGEGDNAGSSLSCLVIQNTQHVLSV